jgi:hypothetical protein
MVYRKGKQIKQEGDSNERPKTEQDAVGTLRREVAALRRATEALTRELVGLKGEMSDAR